MCRSDVRGAAVREVPLDRVARDAVNRRRVRKPADDVDVVPWPQSVDVIVLQQQVEPAGGPARREVGAERARGRQAGREVEGEGMD